MPVGWLSPGPGARREPSVVFPVAPKHFWSEKTDSGFTIVHLPFRVAPARACVAGRAWRSCLPRLVSTDWSLLIVVQVTGHGDLPWLALVGGILGSLHSCGACLSSCLCSLWVYSRMTSSASVSRRERPVSGRHEERSLNAKRAGRTRAATCSPVPLDAVPLDAVGGKYHL